MTPIYDRKAVPRSSAPSDKLKGELKKVQTFEE
jgi:hypothetical protein